ncbi:PKD domain-containing protein [Croceivirga sp. JEA036]|uniref:PKD domain-containing protein n=1 Tax=Croceivirga sp. JEA036 TaxID=2721162 RepID=UPI001438764C|nr:PKD domain-containing protein [Croceivirga sp. JEA036]NJB37690.1 PKD domain-containing protein [Croceivirga sp. JEA036]
MKNSIDNIKNYMFAGIALLGLAACDFEYDIAEEASIDDLTPPSASFSASQSEVDFLQYAFANQSNSATTYAWDFGDGNTSDEIDPVNIYPAEGTYTVSLTASDALGAVSTFTMDITVVEPEEPEVITPVVLEADFEDLSLPDGTGDGRDSWRNDFGGVIQITGSPVQSGDQAAKFPSAGDRVAYQSDIAVTPNTDYVLTYYYTLKTDNPGSITLSVIGGGISDLAELDAAKLADFVGDNQTSANDYVKVDLAFNSGANASIAILITNQGAEARLDNISIEPAQ